MSFAEFINMGGYGFYIWSSYILTVIVFAVLYGTAKARRGQLIRNIRVQSTNRNRNTSNNDETTS